MISVICYILSKAQLEPNELKWVHNEISSSVPPSMVGESNGSSLTISRSLIPSEPDSPRLVVPDESSSSSLSLPTQMESQEKKEILQSAIPQNVDYIIQDLVATCATRFSQGGGLLLALPYTWNMFDVVMVFLKMNLNLKPGVPILVFTTYPDYFQKRIREETNGKGHILIIDPIQDVKHQKVDEFIQNQKNCLILCPYFSTSFKKTMMIPITRYSPSQQMIIGFNNPLDWDRTQFSSVLSTIDRKKWGPRDWVNSPSLIFASLPKLERSFHSTPLDQLDSNDQYLVTEKMLSFMDGPVYEKFLDLKGDGAKRDTTINIVVCSDQDSQSLQRELNTKSDFKKQFTVNIISVHDLTTDRFLSAMTSRIPVFVFGKIELRTLSWIVFAYHLTKRMVVSAHNGESSRYYYQTIKDCWNLYERHKTIVIAPNNESRLNHLKNLLGIDK